MFTGLIQSVGKIHLQGKGVLVEVPSSFSSLILGESISVNGVCLTVSSLRSEGFLADVSEETLKRTALGEKAASQAFVNLEKALRLSDRLGGHLVSGHVDGLGQVISIKALPQSWLLQIKWKDPFFKKYTCKKASIAINGVSLTVSDIEGEGHIFSTAVIPHTWINTSLQYLKSGELVHLEADLMAKYAESLLRDTSDELAIDSNENNSEISQDWLADNGFL